MDPVAELIGIEVRLARLTRDLSDRILSAPPEGDPDSTLWCDYGFKWPAYTLAHLYRTEHPGNPLRGEEWCIDLAVKLTDKWVDDCRYRTAQGLTSSSLEVPNYIIAALLEWLADRLGDERRASWIACADAWAAEAVRRPLGLTGNYHDAWRFLALYRLGQALDRAEWREMGLLFFRQAIALQTGEGFWEERRHHGPSMRYNGLMLPALAWVHRLAGDEGCGRAAEKLARFMATYTYPDAITVGPFDGRNSPMLAFFPTCAGLELALEGRALAARAFGLWRDLGLPTDLRFAAESVRDAVRVAFYAADTCVYIGRYAPDSAVDPSGALPIDADGTVENHSPAFDGMLCRTGPWAVAVSGQNSEIPRAAPNPYRLERQSRIELWHRDARLVLGGGHNLWGAEVPYANAMLDTGYVGPVEFGVIDAAERRRRYVEHSLPRAGERGRDEPDPHELHDLFQAYYFPRVAEARVEDGVPTLTLVFGHGTVRFRVVVEGDARCAIDAEWDVRRVERLCIQLPLVVWLGAELRVDGTRAHVVGGPFGSWVTLCAPDDVPCMVRHPLQAQPTFSGRLADDAFQPPFGLALVSCQRTDPPHTGRMRFTLTVGAA